MVTLKFPEGLLPLCLAMMQPARYHTFFRELAEELLWTAVGRNCEGTVITLT